MLKWITIRSDKREYDIPPPAVRRVQEVLRNTLLREIPVHRAAHGYLPGRSPYTALLPHVGCRYLMHLDLRRFFHSCTESLLILGLSHAGVTPWDSLVIRHNCCYRGRLPLGPCTSPALSNICCRLLDAELSRAEVYTRYSDQLLLSGSRPPDERLIRSIIEDHGFRVNEWKSWLRVRGRGKLTVMGWTVGETEVYRSRAWLKRQRARLHRLGLEANGEAK